MFQKITIKIDIIGTCPKFPRKDFGPLGIYIPPYALKLSYNLSNLHLFVSSSNIFQNYLGPSIFYKNVLALAMTYFLELNRSQAYSMNPTNIIGYLNI
jgi:hypothetical protein